MKKNFILDTTILLYDPNALFAFADNNVIIPIIAIEEIDRFKKEVTENGRNARHASRILDTLRVQGNLVSGVKLDNGGVLFVRSGSVENTNKLSRNSVEKKRDAFLFAVALDFVAENALPTIFVTKDVYMRIKADSLGIKVEDFESERVAIEELYTGHGEVMTTSQNVASLKAGVNVTLSRDYYANQYITLIDEKNGENYSYGKYDGKKGVIVPLIHQTKYYECRISSKNREQAFALDALLDDTIGFVSLVGKAGTGKTLLAIAASLYKTVDENVYHRVLISRPTLAFSQDIGFLPGTVEEKMMPWMYPIVDNVDLIMRSQNSLRHKIRGFKELVEMGIMVIEPLTYIRGRSIHNQFLIVDEAQNLTPQEIKTIITRVGEGTKIVLTGDPYQIDNPYIDSASNGLTYVVEKFKKEQLTAHVTLVRGERSPLSELAANLL